jgi:hypothetical protein
MIPYLWTNVIPFPEEKRFLLPRDHKMSPEAISLQNYAQFLKRYCHITHFYQANSKDLVSQQLQGEAYTFSV